MNEKKPKKKGGIGRVIKRILLIILILAIAFVALCAFIIKKDEADQKAELHSTLNWPTDTTVAKILPKPDSDVGKIDMEYDDSISADIPDTSQDQFNVYVNKCSDVGFNVDFSKSDTSYSSHNADKFYLSLDLDDDNTMRILLLSPTKKSDSNDTTDVTPTPETAEVTEEPAEQVETVDSTGIRPEVKEAIDSYETFMNSYCDFMTKYSESDDVVSMMTDYADYMQKYTDATQKFDDLEDDLNDEELKYYVEVQTRVSQKLANVAIDMN